MIATWRCTALLAFAALSAVAEERSVSGTINTAKALRLLYGNYDAKSHQSKDAGGALVSEYATLRGVLSGKEVWFLYTTSNTPGNDCHACQVTLGAAMFENQGGKWIERVDDKYLAAIGNSGYARDCKPVLWGKEAYGLLIDDGWMGYGQLSSFQSLWAFENGSFRRLFNMQLLDNNAGSLSPRNEIYGWEAEWKFLPAISHGAFDITVKMKPGSSFPPRIAARERIPVPGVYRYDGSVYRHATKHIPFNVP